MYLRLYDPARNMNHKAQNKWVTVHKELEEMRKETVVASCKLLHPALRHTAKEHFAKSVKIAAKPGEM